MRTGSVLLGGFLLICYAQVGAGLPDTVARLKPSVVLVGSFKATDSPRFQLRGTGFIVGNGQLVVTNAHALPEEPTTPDAPRLVVPTRDGKGAWQVQAVKVLEIDDGWDLALLRMEVGAGPAVVVGDSSRIREGEELAFMGFPIGSFLGDSVVTHRATVSSIASAVLPSPTAQRLKGQAIRGLRNGTFELFQLDVTAYPGNSGGPLFDPETGDLVGVMNLVLIKNTRESAMSQPSGIAYAIPARYVKELIEPHP